MPFVILILFSITILQERLKIDLQGLYASLLDGNCPCHEFTKVERQTGGFCPIVLSTWGMCFIVT